MKRWIIFSCVFLLFFAAAASAWASCRQISFTPDLNLRSPTPLTAHHHGSDSHHHEHSHGTALHCPALDQFLFTARFSASSEHRVEHLPNVVSAEFDYRAGAERPYYTLHWPPGLAPFNVIPPYLLLSVLRI